MVAQPKCDCIGLMLFRYPSCLGVIICDINTIEFVSVYACRVCDALVASCATVHLATALSVNQNGRPTLNEGSQGGMLNEGITSSSLITPA